MSDKRVCALILAAGIGSRMGAVVTKQKIEICGKSILFRTIDAFERADAVSAIYIVCREDEIDFVKSELAIGGFSKIRGVLVGGSTRAESARLGFEAVEKDFDTVAIHDAARCLVSPELINNVVLRANECGAASAVRRVNDTVKRVDENGYIYKTESRDELRLAETPQAFAVTLYRKALDHINKEGIAVTDDNMLIEHMGALVAAVESVGENLKITTPRDLKYAEFIIERGGAL